MAPSHLPSPHAPVSDAAVLAAAGETEAQREARLTTLFHAFDTRRTGFVERKEIESGLKRLSVPSSHKYALELLTACDENDDGQCSYEEFQRHMRATEEELFSLFRSIDVDSDGSLTPSELLGSLQAAGISVDEAEMKDLIKKMDADGDGTISFTEWRDLLLLFPRKATIGGVYRYWTKACQVDAGDFVPIPEGVSSKSGEAWKYLSAGALAGAISRTATAPFDRLKVMMQVQGAFDSKPRAPGASTPATTHVRTAGVPAAAPTASHVGKAAPAAVATPAASATSAAGTQAAAGQPRPAGAVAGAAKVPAVAPRAAAGAGAGGMRWAAAAIYKEAGWMGFFRGNGLQVLKMGPETALRFYIYEQMKPAVAKSWRQLTGSDVNEEEVGAGVKFISGGLAGALAQTGLYPLEVLKTRIQTHNLSATAAATPNAAANASASASLKPRPGSSYVPRLRVALQSAGVGAAPTLQTTAASMHNSGAAGNRTAGTVPPRPTLPSALPLSTSTSAGSAVPAAATLPRPRPISPSALFLNILRTEGPAAYYRGLGPSIVGMFPYSGIDLALYETLKTSAASFMLARQRRMQQATMGASLAEADYPPMELSPLVQLACGTVSGAVSATAVYPLQVIRTRLQAVPFKTVEGGPKLTPWSVSSQIWKAEGFRGFYSGLAPNLLKVAPQAALTFVVYEYVKSLLNIK